MRISDAEREIEYLMTCWRLYNVGWSYRWGKSTRRAGYCSVNPTGRKQLTFSRPAFRINTARLGLAVIAHEIAHAVCWERGLGLKHDISWSYIACEIGGEIASNVRTPMKRPRGQHRYRCVECRSAVHRTRRVRAGFELGCAVCRKSHKSRGVWVALKEIL